MSGIHFNQIHPDFAVKNFINIIKSAPEAECLVTCKMWLMRLEAEMRAYLINIEYGSHLQEIIWFIQTKSAIDSTILTTIPMLRNCLKLNQESSIALAQRLRQLLDDLIDIEASLQQYGTQNKCLADELDSIENISGIAYSKRFTSALELSLATKLRALICAASAPVTPELINQLSSLLSSDQDLEVCAISADDSVIKSTPRFFGIDCSPNAIHPSHQQDKSSLIQDKPLGEGCYLTFSVQELPETTVEDKASEIKRFKHDQVNITTTQKECIPRHSTPASFLECEPPVTSSMAFSGIVSDITHISSADYSGGISRGIPPGSSPSGISDVSNSQQLSSQEITMTPITPFVKTEQKLAATAEIIGAYLIEDCGEAGSSTAIDSTRKRKFPEVEATQCDVQEDEDKLSATAP